MRGRALENVDALTFDCYGTLIDWDRGVSDALAAVPSLAGCDPAALVEARHVAEREIQLGDYLPYSECVAESLRRAGRTLEREVSEAEAAAFAASIGDWPPFAESRAQLGRLAARFRLAILSNIETATLERSVALLGVAFDELVTAEQLRSYKPAAAHFHEGLRRLGLPSERVLHVAQSWYHDVVPARSLGWRVAWVNRLGEPRGKGDVEPTLEVRTLAELADALG